MEVVTDGEMRRLSFQSGLPDAVDGFGEVPLEAYLWGDWHGEEVGDRSTERPAGLGVREPLRRRRHIAAEDFTYLRGRATAIPKVTLTSPSLYANLWSPTHSRDAYPTLDAFLEDVAAITRDEIAELARLGCTYVQLDAPHYPLLIDARTRAFYEAAGVVGRAVARPRHRARQLGRCSGHPGVTFGFHLCRGNQGSRWLATGGYEPIARRVFAGVEAHRLLLEYDDERSGSFQPLDHVPDDRMVVLGLVTTKSGRRETPAELEGRIREAAAHVDLERLAISPQCGFATSIVGNAADVRRPAGEARDPRPNRRARLGVETRPWRESWPPTREYVTIRPVPTSDDIPSVLVLCPGRRDRLNLADERIMERFAVRLAGEPIGPGFDPAAFVEHMARFGPGRRRRDGVERRHRPPRRRPGRAPRPAGPGASGVHALPRQARVAQDPGRGRPRGDAGVRRGRPRRPRSAGAAAVSLLPEAGQRPTSRSWHTDATGRPTTPPRSPRRAPTSTP